MKIVLIGYMGSGKSTLAKLLAAQLGLPFADLDDYIEAGEQLSVKEIFRKKGEVYFRLQESKYLKELLKDQIKGVLALGGGTPCYANNMQLIKKAAVSVYLKGSIPVICRRLQGEKQQRPLIASLNDEQLTEFVAKHLFERRAYYEQADFTLLIENKTVEELLSELTKLI